jgi:branched-subunit amino acid aminotransferase/4-amino-4-deoxychorismate lyase
MDGIMAGQVIAAAAAHGLPVRQVRVGADALTRADAIFLTSSLIGVRPGGLVGRAPPAPSLVVERLAAAVSRFV